MLGLNMIRIYVGAEFYSNIAWPPLTPVLKVGDRLDNTASHFKVHCGFLRRIDTCEISET